MKKQYISYSNITKDILDTVKIGDLIKCNDWKRPMKVVGVSENYFVMTQSVFGKVLYSVCEKKKAGYSRNNFQENQFRTGPDAWLFGWKGDAHKWDDKKWLKNYLESFEIEESELSVRSSIGIQIVSIKSL